MRIVAQINPLNGAVSNLTFPPTISGNGTLIIKNKSILDIIYTAPDGDNMYVESGMARRWDKDFTNIRTMSWKTVPSNWNNLSGVLLNFMLFNVFIVEAYQEYEEITESYPQIIPVGGPLPIAEYVAAGMVFTASTSRQNAAGALNAPLSVYNPGPNTFMIFSLFGFAEVSSGLGYFFRSPDPAFVSAATLIPHYANVQGNGTANCTFKVTNEAASYAIKGTMNNSSLELLTNGDVLFLPGFQILGSPPTYQRLPNGVGITLVANLSATGHYGLSVSYVEIPAGGEIL